MSLSISLNTSRNVLRGLPMFAACAKDPGQGRGPHPCQHTQHCMYTGAGLQCHTGLPDGYNVITTMSLYSCTRGLCSDETPHSCFEYGGSTGQQCEHKWHVHQYDHWHRCARCLAVLNQQRVLVRACRAGLRTCTLLSLARRRMGTIVVPHLPTHAPGLGPRNTHTPRITTHLVTHTHTHPHSSSSSSSAHRQRHPSVP